MAINMWEPRWVDHPCVVFHRRKSLYQPWDEEAAPCPSSINENKYLAGQLSHYHGQRIRMPEEIPRTLPHLVQRFNFSNRGTLKFVMKRLKLSRVNT